VKLNIKEDALREIARMAVERKTGARGLRGILEKILMRPMFDAPDKTGLKEIIIDKNVVAGKKDPVEIFADAKKAA
ncbi:MAG: ATP-dependent Clp protease ATP-binding subunit ClpX, partial [Alphaproteobacteria bacterium]|nr:ATP-dependent Clp protease ATP-binding subunit ClpX [Alphaproteobacteria bacterium]